MASNNRYGVNLMIDEKEISGTVIRSMQAKAQKAIQALKKNNFDAEYVADGATALAKIMDKIPQGATIGRGDSVTLHQIGFVDWLKTQKEHQVFDPFAIEFLDFDNDWVKYRNERFRLMQKALTANVFLTSSNAITLDGKIVNIDGHGNRVGGMLFGPNKCIIIAGVNKVVKDVDAAFERISHITAPVAARRHVEKHGWKNDIGQLPCVVTGVCNKCSSQNKVCRCITIIDGWSPLFHCPAELQPSVIIVGESLGV
jgi:hypothetical protein